MEWGIINSENFTDLYEIPIKRWDPLSTVKITSEDFGYRKEHPSYYGHYSYISPIRGSRPKGFKDVEQEKQFNDCSKKLVGKYKDVFTSITEGKLVYNDWGTAIGDSHTMIISQDEAKQDNPFSEKPHRIERIPDTCKALTLINRFFNTIKNCCLHRKKDSGENIFWN